MEESVTEEERKGIKMIIALQGMVGIDEAETKALAGWRGMSASEKATTRMVYGLFNKEDDGQRTFIWLNCNGFNVIGKGTNLQDAIGKLNQEARALTVYADRTAEIAPEAGLHHNSVLRKLPPVQFINSKRR